jgi:hypothetical protein
MPDDWRAMATERDLERDTDSLLREVLRAAAQLEGWEIAQPERIVILQGTPQQWVMRIVDRDGERQAQLVEINPPDAG